MKHNFTYCKYSMGCFIIGGRRTLLQLILPITESVEPPKSGHTKCLTQWSLTRGSRFHSSSNSGLRFEIYISADFAYSSPLRATHNDLTLQSYFSFGCDTRFISNSKVCWNPAKMKDSRGKPTNQTNNHQQTKEKKVWFSNVQPTNYLARFYFMLRSIGYRKKGKLTCIK